MIALCNPLETNNGRPLVSVIIPAYNRSWTLEKTISSVFEDTYRPIECIVVDDGSKDDTAAVIAHLQKECPNGIELRYIQKENGGANSARNRGLMECTGEFICFLDSDDYLINDSIEVRARILSEDPDVDLCYGLSSTRDEQGKEIGQMNSPWPEDNEARISKYLFHTNSPMIRRGLCQKAGLWREDDPGAQEAEYFAKIKYYSRKQKFINKTLSAYVKHENDRIVKSSKFWYGIYKNLLAIKIIIIYGIYDNLNERCQLSKGFRGVAKKLYHKKDYYNACKALEESLLLNKNLKTLTQWVVIKCFDIVKGH